MILESMVFQINRAIPIDVEHRSGGAEGNTDQY